MAFGPWNPGGAPDQGLQKPGLVPNQGLQNPGGVPIQSQQQVGSMRASNTDRERAIDVLKAGFSEGRLGQDEYEQRLARASHAQTYAELTMLIADLPQGPVPMPQPAYPSVPQTFLPKPPPSTNGSAIGALVCGVLSPLYGLTAIPAVILGHKAKAEIRRTGEQGDGLAMAGLVLGYLAIGAILTIILGVIVATS